MNANLRKIEDALDIEITSRGNEISISGKTDSVNCAVKILDELWAKLQEDEEIDVATVEDALRFVDDKSNGNKDKYAGSFSTADISIITKKKKILPRSPLQAAYIETMRNNHMVFATGPAGTGKTFLAVATAVSMLEKRRIERIILSRPALEAGERIGFLPGEIKEKMDPYMRPLYDSLQDTMSADKLQKSLASEEIEIAPLAFMRGRTLNNSFVILDEAQNASTIQMKMALTRIGENSHMVITGDASQTDLPKGEKSGLLEAIDVLTGVEDIDFISFSHKDVIRSKLVTNIVKAYDARTKN
jgi:phosphate starvation-inducible PhoH-like protein